MRIIIRENTIECKPPMNAEQLTNTLLSVLFSVYKDNIQSVPAEHQPLITKHLFDNFNAAASEFLKQLDPESDLRPDLTEEAILEAENAILDRGETYHELPVS
jgi:hypothetical protein